MQHRIVSIIVNVWMQKEKNKRLSFPVSVKSAMAVV